MDCINYIVGKIHHISERAAYGQNTEVVEVWIETGHKYKSYPSLQFKNSFIAKLRNFEVGDMVTISFKLEGYVTQNN